MKKSTYTILCLEGAVLSFNVAAASALIPSIAKEFSASQFVTGSIVWLYMLPYGFAALFYGPLVRFFSAKKVELICFFLFCLANLFAAFSKNLYTLFAARFFMGVFGASVVPLVLILIANHSKPQNRGKLVGRFFSATFVASLLGLALSSVLSWRMIFLIPAVFGMMLWINMYFYLEDFKPEEEKARINYRAAFRNKAVISVFIYIFFISLFYHSVQQWLGVYFSKTFDFSQFAISILITLTSLSGIIGEAWGGSLSDSLGRIKTINIGIALMVVCVFSLFFKSPLIFLAVTMIVWGLGWTFNHAGLSTLLTDLPKEFLNESASLNSSVRFLSGGLGAAFGGILMQKSFNLGFIVIGVSLAVLAVFSRNILKITEA